MKKSEIILIQSALKEKGLYTKELDGIKGEKTDQAIYDFLFRNSIRFSPHKKAF